MMSFKMHGLYSAQRMKKKVNQVAYHVKPKTIDDTEAMVRIYGEELAKSKKRAGVDDFSGHLSRALRKVHTEKNNVFLSLPQYMYPLSRMKPHYVSLANPQNAPIQRWVQQKKNQGGSDNVKRRGKEKHGRGGYMYVRPHPFITNGEQNARRRIARKVERGELEVIKTTRKILKGG